jgi:hypothetical protein
MNLRHIIRESVCLNCGRALNEETDNYCPECGQLNNIRKETAWEMVRELAGDFLHLDSKVTRNLRPLLFYPGKLTKEYLAGRRARYFHPVRLFLSVTVIMFIVNSFTGGSEEKKDHNLVVGESDTQIITAAPGDTVSTVNLNWRFREKSVPNDTLKKYIRDLGITDTDHLLDTLGIEKTFFSKLFFGQVIKSHTQGFDRLTDYYKHKLPWMIFALVPVFAFLLWVIYIRKKYFYSDHLVFAFHLHAATFVIYSLIALLSLLNDNAWYLLLLLPVYYFSALKNVYGQSWGRTIFKGLILGAVYMVTGATVFFAISLLLFVMY